MIEPRPIAEVIVGAPSTAEDLEEATQRLREEPLFDVDPCVIWLLLAFARHLPRQRWVGEVVEGLGGDLGEISRNGAFGHPEDLAGCGRIPGEGSWGYELHGRGCCLTNDDGTMLDVDFIDGRCETIDVYFYSAYLNTVAEPGWVERRIRHSEPLDRFWMAYLPDLERLGLVEGAHHIGLTPEGMAAATALQVIVEKVEGDGPEWRKKYFAAALGDLDLESAVKKGQRADALVGRLADADAIRTGFILQALALLDRELAEEHVLQALTRDPPDGTVSTALEIVNSWGDSGHAPRLLDLLNRCTGNEIPRPHIRQRIGEMLFSLLTPETMAAEVRAGLAKGLEGDQWMEEGSAAFFSYLLDSDAGLQRLHRTLSHEVPMARTEAASALAIIGTSEARAVLSRHDGAEARAALSVLEGRTVEPGPDPEGAIIEHGGRELRIYSMVEVVAADTPGMTSEKVRELTKRWGPLLQSWVKK